MEEKNRDLEGRAEKNKSFVSITIATVSHSNRGSVAMVMDDDDMTCDVCCVCWCWEHVSCFTVLNDRCHGDNVP